jgi:uncharacterized protein
MQKLIGREEEIEILQKALASDDAEMVAVIGRRRVGKTYLINQICGNQIKYSITGVQDAPMKEQLSTFSFQLNEYSHVKTPFKTPENWLEAFQILISFLKEKMATSTDKPVVFLDELPWLDTHKSGFLRGLSFFWNTWATHQNIVVIVCGSAASWMIQKVVHHKGGLHNRITKRIYLEPFTLSETERFLISRKVHLERYHLVQLYMAMGGIPHYLKEIEAGKSATQIINQVCFSKNGLLRDEFSKLYTSLFANAEKHISVIKALSQKRLGLTRSQILEVAKISESGTIQRVLEELEQSGFIATYRPFNKLKKEKIYRLTDEYSLFYLQFMEDKAYEGTDIWNYISQTQEYKIWSGYAFEGLCMKHLPQIKKSLGITGIYSLSSSFYKKGTKTEEGTQIDLVLDRGDHAINLFEIKFSNQPYLISNLEFENLQQKIRVFKKVTNTNKQLFFVFITTFGLTENQYSGLLHKTLVLDDLFNEK